MTVKDTEWFRDKVSSFTNEDIPSMAEELRKLDRESRKNLYDQVDFQGLIKGLSLEFPNEAYVQHKKLCALSYSYHNYT